MKIEIYFEERRILEVFKLLRKLLSYLESVFSDIIDLIKWLIKNIPFWIVILLSILFYSEKIEGLISGKEMLIFSTGLISIITFISNYLDSQVTDIDKKENFYLGFNIKKAKFYDNFWLKRFSNVPIRLFFWLIAVIPVLILFSEVKYSNPILKIIYNLIIQKHTIIISIWLAIFVVSTFYCIAILIESLELSRMSFWQSYVYVKARIFDKYNIEKKVEKNFKETYNMFLSVRYFFKKYDVFYNDISYFFRYIFDNASKVSNNVIECDTYITIAYYEEQKVIKNLLNKISKNEETTTFIKKYLLRQRIEMLHTYYEAKLNTLHLMTPDKIAILSYLEIIYYDLKMFIVSKEFSAHKKNLYISKILKIFYDKFSNIDFINKLENTDCIFKILNYLDSIYKNECGESELLQYFSSIFRVMYNHSIKEKNKDSKIVKEFLNKIKENRDRIKDRSLLIKGVQEESEKILMEGDRVSAENLKYLISFLNLNNIISALIYQLAHRGRVNREIMSIEEFNIWKNAINNIMVYGENINKLKKNNYIKELCEVIKSSNISHFITTAYLEWLWDSLFKTFNDTIYDEFKEKDVREFSLKSYIILRLLIHNYWDGRFEVHIVNTKNRNEIEEKLQDIKDILEKGGLYLYSMRGE